jgi:hypothetical protein
MRLAIPICTRCAMKGPAAFSSSVALLLIKPSLINSRITPSACEHSRVARCTFSLNPAVSLAALGGEDATGAAREAGGVVVLEFLHPDLFTSESTLSAVLYLLLASLACACGDSVEAGATGAGFEDATLRVVGGGRRELTAGTAGAGAVRVVLGLGTVGVAAVRSSALSCSASASVGVDLLTAEAGVSRVRRLTGAAGARVDTMAAVWVAVDVTCSSGR